MTLSSEPLLQADEGKCENEKEAQGTYETLGKKSPFLTILNTTWGPFIAEIVGATYGIIDSFWIAKYAQQSGNAAMTLVSLMDAIVRAFGMFMSSAASSQLSFLRGENLTSEIPQVFADLLRITILLGLIVPAILLPLINPLLAFFNAEGDVWQHGHDYLMITCSGAFVTCMNLLLCGCLQSEGRSVAYGVNQVLSFILNMAAFDPLFMGAFKLGLKGAGISTLLSDGIPMVIFLIMFLCGKFDTKVNFKNFLSKFSPKTWPAIKVGFTQLVSHICFSLPSFFSRKYLEIGATEMGKYKEILAALNPTMRIWSFPGSYAVALSISILPAMSYAYGAKRYKRILSLFKVGVLMSAVWCGAAEAIILGLGKYIAMLFGSDEDFLMLTWKMMFITYMAAVVMGVEMISASFLQSMQYATAAVILSILTRFMPVPLFGTILFFSDKSHNVFRTLLMYPISDVFSCITGLICCIFPIRKVKKLDSDAPLISTSMTSTNIEENNTI